MAEWVLILWLQVDRGGGLATQVMSSKAACEIARDAFVQSPKTMPSEKRSAICVER